MYNWMQKISSKKLIDEINRWGWTESQLRKDGVSIYQNSDQFFISIGDWAKLDVDDIVKAIEKFHPGAKVEWDYEAGPGEGNWEKIF